MYNNHKFVASVSHYKDADGNEVPGTEKFATKEEYDAWKASQSNGGKFVESESFWNNVSSNINNFLKIFQKESSTDNTTDEKDNNNKDKKDNNNGNDNTMLYVGIGGAVLVVVLLLVIVLKK